MSKCLILATYNGNYKISERRRCNFNINNIKCNLENINQDLFNKIIIVIKEETDNKYINLQYDKYLKNIIETDKIKKINIVNDEFLSYSSYYYAYLKYSDFDYYYFFEDDYIITENFINYSENKFINESYDYIFGCINYNAPVVHATHCLTGATKKCLNKLFSSDFIENMKKTKHCHQIAFFIQFDESKFKGSDFFESKLRLPFFITSQNRIIYWFKSNKKCAVYPTQFFYLKKKKHLNGKKFDNYINNYI